MSGLQFCEEELLPEVATLVTQQSDDPIMKSIYREANSVGLGDNAGFFLDNAGQLAAPNYIPIDEEILKTRLRMAGIAYLNFQIEKVKKELEMGVRMIVVVCVLRIRMQ
jgi:hypothetical protein